MHCPTKKDTCAASTEEPARERTSAMANLSHGRSISGVVLRRRTLSPNGVQWQRQHVPNTGRLPDIIGG